MPVTFLYPAVLVAVVLVIPVLWLRRKRQPAIAHSRVKVQKDLRGLTLVGRIPSILFTLWFIALVAALARPVLPEVKETRSIQTRDIVIAVDISGSMDGSLPGTPPPGSKPSREGQWLRKDGAQDAVIKFVERRDGDRIALLLFDTQTFFHWPLSDDKKIILRKATQIAKHSGGGTDFSGVNGPIQAAIFHLTDYGKAKTKVLILVTDGEDSIAEQRFVDLASQMDQAGIKLYVLGIGWGKDTQNDLAKFTARLNGNVFAAGSNEEMQAAMETINSLEKSNVQIERTTDYRDVYQYFVGASVILLLAFLASVVITREEA